MIDTTNRRKKNYGYNPSIWHYNKATIHESK